MRADRLVATLLLMQARGRVTAGEVAEELEVSVATARRDLEALSAAGIPVYPQPGRGGGWRLLGGARTDLSGLTAGEVRALFLLVGPAAAVDPAARAALRKLVAALPHPFRTQARAAAEAVVVDPARWGAVAVAAGATVEALREAVVRRRWVRFRYRDGGGRQADPWGLVDKDGTWYLVAGTDRGRRTFRVDRMSGVALTERESGRPEGFDLDAVWAEVVGVVEGRRSAASAVVVLEPRFAPVLCGQFGRHATVLDAGEARVRVRADTPLSIARHLAGWGGAVTVDSPAVRTELARIGAELTARYP